MQFVTLSNSFYQDYADCPQLLQKKERPYLCLTARIDGILFAIPIRHYITHKYAIRTFGTAGLDFSKAVVIRDNNDVDNWNAWISKEEHDFLKTKEKLIENGMRKYLRAYRNAINYNKNPHYKNILLYSSLQYFREYL